MTLDRKPFEETTLNKAELLNFLSLISTRPGFVCFGNPYLEDDQALLISSDPVGRIESAHPAEFQGSPPILKQEQIVEFCAGYFCYEAQHNTRIKERTTDKRRIDVPEQINSHYLWAIHKSKHSDSIRLGFAPDCPDDLKHRILEILADTRQALADKKTGSDQHEFGLTGRFQASIDKQEYIRQFMTIKEAILAGDVYQVNLSQHFSTGYQGSCWGIYQHLCRETDGPYSAFIALENGAIISVSPELFLEVENRRVTTKPIKGTRPRGQNESEDRKTIATLENSTKDRAENLMIVDLLRNDLGKICETGTITVPNLFAIESYTNVHHLVSTICGELKSDHSPLSALLSAFPGGSITGAPKIMAMHIIDQLEKVERGPYCGSLFFYTRDGYMQSNIAIRTLLCENGTIHCWGGGGIVADSDEDSEYDESIAKIRQFMGSLERASQK
ncbi:para-aminobenzoate synthase component I [Oleiphilus messinensis]|uniref:Para-aminobenzoate synthase component I n=1 Tax=Oleiphilus messinensis TaxID=141451 RepID=A0A1Y0IC54_9GAMM|nr:aminodeoxychorismate synthase component I [Oleiphilus messinensis]ARU57356.1 para-aminobenzoate synthase component I [Oleiphilus messinensis]